MVMGMIMILFMKMHYISYHDDGNNNDTKNMIMIIIKIIISIT